MINISLCEDYPTYGADFYILQTGELINVVSPVAPLSTAKG